MIEVSVLSRGRTGSDVWPSFGLYLDNLRAGSGTVLCPGCGMFMWPVMAICVDCLVGISYSIIGCEN